MLQDKAFNADGSMYYPSVGVTDLHPQWVPEFFGDVAVVNAKIWPYVDVEPRRYRLRIVNGSQSRFYNLRFSDGGGETLPFTQIGADGGLLRAPVQLAALLIAPGERADVHRGLRRPARQLVHRHQQRPRPVSDGRAGVALPAAEVPRPAVAAGHRRRRSRPADLELPALGSLPDPSVTRVQHLSETLESSRARRSP